MFTFKILFVVDLLDLVSPFIVIHMYSQCVSGESGPIRRDLRALCSMVLYAVTVYDRPEVVSLTESD